MNKYCDRRMTKNKKRNYTSARERGQKKKWKYGKGLKGKKRTTEICFWATIKPNEHFSATILK